MADISVIRKTTNTLTLTFTDSDGDAVDITGYTVFFTVKNSVAETDTQAQISKTVTTHTNPTGGITTVTLSSTNTDITQGEYLYDIAYIDESSNRYAINPGKFIVIGTVTQRSS